MPRQPSPALLPLLTVSAFLSGLASLALELLWGRQLALTFGGSQYAAAAVLGGFMLGLAAGSWLGGRFADRLRRPLLVIGLIEVGIAVLGPLLSFLLLRLPRIAAAWLPAPSASAPGFYASRLALSALVLLLPTVLMGATFPILARASAHTVDRLHRALGALYAANTVGGMVGAVTAGFLLLPRWGIPGTVAGAAAANLASAGVALLAHRIAHPPSCEAETARAHRPALPLLAAAALSGALVLAAETVWHRGLLLVLANSTATLTLLLALTLAGLGAGAILARPLLRRPQPLLAWGGLQLAAGGMLAAQTVVLPQIAALVRLIRPDTGWPRVLLPPLVVGGAIILPAALVLGAAWPLLLAAATPRLEHGGRRIGTMGVVNAAGAALGAAASGFVLLPALGFGRTLLVLTACHTTLALCALRRARPRLATIAAVGAAATLSAAALAPRFARVLLPSLVGQAHSETSVLAYHESPAGTVVVVEEHGGRLRSMFVDNNAVIGSTYDALKVARMLGVVPILLHPEPRDVLVIGFGAGVTTAMVAGSAEVEHIEVVEIVPAVAEAASFFSQQNHDVAADPRLRLVVNDGRNHLLLSNHQYDVITCDPVHPLYGSAPLYSLDHFRLCRQRLEPGGLLCQYLPLHRMPTPEFRRAINTFQAAFPETWVLFGLGHAMLVGADQPLELDWDRWQQRLRQHRWQHDLADSTLSRPAQIAALLSLDPDMSRTVGAGEPSTDLHPRLEFLAPAAYEPGLWEANARLLVEHYRPSRDRIRRLPEALEHDLKRLVAGKRLLLFSLLRRDAADLEGARGWLRQALQVAGDDPEIVRYARQLAAEGGS